MKSLHSDCASAGSYAPRSAYWVTTDMKATATSILFGVFTTAFLFSVISAAAAMELEISVIKLRNTEGNVLVALYRDPDTFLGKEGFFRTLVIPASRQPPTGVIRDLPEGDYAIALLHDENNNKKMDKRFFVPREGFGFSNNVKVRVRAPSFDDTKFSVNAERTRLVIELQYR